MAENYLKSVNDNFDDKLEDIDDEIFLSNSRLYGSISGNGGRYVGRSTNPFDEPQQNQQQQYYEKRNQIESRIISSTEKSIGLLYETEEVGKATATELAKQREQLEKTSRQLDEINSTLRFSQRHLNGLKSVFGGLKNYLAGNRDQQQTSSRMTASPSDSQISQETNTHVNNTPTCSAVPSLTERYDSHPVSRIRDDSSQLEQRQQIQQRRRNNPFEVQLESNLEEMCNNLSRLKCLATDLGSEIASHNELLDNMNYKIEDVDLKIAKQNKDMNKLLKK